MTTPRAPEGDRWRGWANAEHYDAFVREHSIYDWLNARIVERADLASARRVLDLGCGTGATSRACLARLAFEADIVGVDASPEMLEVARANTLDPRARFVLGPAHDLSELVEGPFDRAVSNAAFWQFGYLERLVDALAAVVAPGGLFVYNVPAEREPDAGPSHGFQVALARAVEARAGDVFHTNAVPFRPDDAASIASSRGFVEAHREVLTWQGPQGELAELMAIPAMLRPLAPSLSLDRAREALDEARGRVDLHATVEVAWTFSVWRRA